MNLTDPRFQDAEKAREWLEMQRWPDGVYCTHCGSFSVTGLQGKAHRPGVYQCNDCRQQFTVTTGSVMERSKIPLNKWLMAMHLMASSKKGYSAHQLHRTLGITYQSAWFLSHRIREAMANSKSGPLGGTGKVVEADETYIGKRETPRKLSRGRIARPTKSGKSGGAEKRIVVGLVERGGNARLFHLNNATKDTVREVLVRNADRRSKLYTDESRLYIETGTEYDTHRSVKHSAKEYVRREGADVVHTNTIENVFSVFKRGMVGVYQHCGEAHLFRYLAEFEFRFNNRSGLGVEDTERASKIIKQAEGRRLTYRRIGEAQNA